MRSRKFWMTTAAGMALMLVTVLPASAKNKHWLRLYNELTSAGVTLPAGEYLIKWQTHSPEATVEFMLKNRVVGELKGKIVEQKEKIANDMVVQGPGPNGTRVLQEIWLGGTNKTIVFEQ